MAETPAASEESPKQRAERPRAIPPGGSTYIAPPVPAPSVPAARLPPNLRIGVYKPPLIDSLSDRVTNGIHSFPLNVGLGNNPTNRDFYVRSCAT